MSRYACFRAENWVVESDNDMQLGREKLWRFVGAAKGLQGGGMQRGQAPHKVKDNAAWGCYFTTGV